MEENTKLHGGGRLGVLIKAVSVVLFAAALYAPLIQQYFKPVEIAAVQENRNKTPRPHDVFTLLKLGGDFASRFEAYFNDAYGFRDFLIRLHNQLNYSLFGKSDKVLISRDGWLFYKNVYEDGILQMESLASGLPKLFERMIRLNEYLKQRGIILVVVPCPMKTTVYAEEVPSGYLNPPQVSVFQKYRSFLHQHPEIVSVDAYGRLMELKREMRVYHKTDFHWNDPAGARVMKDMIWTLGRVSGVGVAWNDPLRIRIDKNTGGGEINSLAVFWPPYEDMLMNADNPSVGIGKLTDSGRPNEWVYEADAKSPAKLLPPTVMFGDSFADAFLRSGLTLPFSRLSKFYNLEFKDRFAAIAPDTKILILEHIETNLIQMLLDSYWPKEIGG